MMKKRYHTATTKTPRHYNIPSPSLKSFILADFLQNGKMICINIEQLREKEREKKRVIFAKISGFFSLWILVMGLVVMVMGRHIHYTFNCLRKRKIILQPS